MKVILCDVFHSLFFPSHTHTHTLSGMITDCSSLSVSTIGSKQPVPCRLVRADPSSPVFTPSVLPVLLNAQLEVLSTFSPLHQLDQLCKLP